MEQRTRVVFGPSEVVEGERYFVLLEERSFDFLRALMAVWRCSDTKKEAPGEEEWDWAADNMEMVQGVPAIRLDAELGREKAEDLSRRIVEALSYGQVRTTISSVLQSRRFRGQN